MYNNDYDTLLEIACTLKTALTAAETAVNNILESLTAIPGPPSAYAVGKIELALHNACNQLALLQALYRVRENHSIPVRNVYGNADCYVIATPYLPRKNNTLLESYVTCGALVDRLCLEHHLTFDTASHIGITMIQVYPTGTPEHYMTDPDNVAIKRMVDNIAVAMGIDDGGTTIRISALNIVSNRISAGMYTIVEPRNHEEETLYYAKKLEAILYDANGINGP